MVSDTLWVEERGSRRRNVLMTAVYWVISVNSWLTIARAAGASSGVCRAINALSGAGAANADDAKVLATAKLVRERNCMLDERWEDLVLGICKR